MKIDEKELKEIFDNIRINNKIQFEKLYKRYNRIVYRIAFSILKNKEDSEDVVQIVFSKIYQMDKDKLPKDKEASWLYTVTKNEVITLLRKKKDFIDIDSIYEIEDKDDEINNIIDQDSYNRLISKLNNKEKEVISLKILTNLSFEEIGKLLNEPTGTIKWRYYKSVHTLKILLSNLGMFIITFAIGVKTMFNNKMQNQTQDQESIVTDNTTENIKEETKAESTEIVKENIIQDSINKEDLKEETIIQSNVNNINLYEIGILSISWIFLLFTIIFTIFFAKYQLKRKKKTSK